MLSAAAPPGGAAWTLAAAAKSAPGRPERTSAGRGWAGEESVSYPRRRRAHSRQTPTGTSIGPAMSDFDLDVLDPPPADPRAIEAVAPQTHAEPGRSPDPPRLDEVQRNRIQDRRLRLLTLVTSAWLCKGDRGWRWPARWWADEESVTYPRRGRADLRHAPTRTSFSPAVGDLDLHLLDPPPADSRAILAVAPQTHAEPGRIPDPSRLDQRERNPIQDRRPRILNFVNSARLCAGACGTHPAWRISRSSPWRAS